MKVKPAPGLKVRDPVLKDYLPDEGREVGDFDLYYIRRLRDGDVVLVDEAASVADTKDVE
ncbi:conserved hypothetical protein [Paraburkholderia piptadeniae]|uniref:DUF2635 domain-containing protein n=1 Tax=Paraburkholderia piptadeniae TaxID=1701573 RepID=A0A1N7SSK1_9BURK|nr:DUF2635 domain-containing protein [Paraburkholderia piptadeniae]SIT50441.1 conserved hypothetical protein [Paraburkholderia piptadeniae]